MTGSLMRAEIGEIPAAARRFLAVSAGDLARAAQAMRFADPSLIVTVARGSSDHAAAYLKYAAEIVAGVPVASVGPSIASVYRRELRLGGAAALAISQSGRSPDLVALLESAGRGGALTLAITNDAASPLARAADHAVPLAAGPELSVAATKTYVTSVLAALALVAAWREDRGLAAAVAAAPAAFQAALGCDWSPLAARLACAASLFVIGRGPGYAVACEMALKFKETCGIHAEAYSAAEVLHGPAALAGPHFPVLALAVPDAAGPGVAETARRLAGQGADVFLTDAAEGTVALPSVPGLHPLVAPLVLVVSFYVFIEALARARGLDPDRPPHLAKVTSTV